MRLTVFLTLIAILAFAAVPANAQFGNLKKSVKDKVKSEQNQTKENSADEKASATTSEKSPETKNDGTAPPFLFVGADKLEDASISALRVCANNYSGSNPLKTQFKQWIDDISSTAQEKMFAGGRCELMGFYIDKNRKYNTADSLETTAQGNSVYKVEGDKLVLVKDFVAADLYVVVVPDASKTGLALKDLNLCVTPDLKDSYRRKTASVSNCHDLKQSLYVFEKYKSYPGPMQTNSALFFASDFEKLNKEGKFKGLVVYKLVGAALEPVK